MHLCLFEDDQVAHLLPLTYTRAVYDLRLGMRTLLATTQEAFAATGTLLHARRSVATVMGQEHDLVVNRVPEGLNVLFVNGRYIAEEGALLERLRAAARPGEPGRVFVQGDDVIAAWVPEASSRLIEQEAVTRVTFEGLPEETVEGARCIGRLWHLLEEIHPALLRDYQARIGNINIFERPGARIHDRAVLVNAEKVYVAPGAVVRPGAILNAEDGPIYIDRDAVIMENAVVRGPAYVGERTQIKVGASVEGSAFGMWSKVGGEVHDSVIHSYSNKGHPGFMGHSYLGRWCNLGADTNTSNLKNDYGEATLYNVATGAMEPTGRQFVGLFMGDHAKCGINTMFNTGTVVGVSANLFGADYPDRYVPSFSWGGATAGLAEYRLEKALRVAEVVMARRNVPMTDADRNLLTHVFEATRDARLA